MVKSHPRQLFLFTRTEFAVTDAGAHPLLPHHAPLNSPPCTATASHVYKSLITSLPGFEYSRWPLRSRSASFLSAAVKFGVRYSRRCPARFRKGETKVIYIRWFFECVKKENEIVDKKIAIETESTVSMIILDIFKVTCFLILFGYFIEIE